MEAALRMPTARKTECALSLRVSARHGTILTGEVRENIDPSFPFIAVVSDEKGKLVATRPAHNSSR
jgi:hypothetical protein